MTTASQPPRSSESRNAKNNSLLGSSATSDSSKPRANQLDSCCCTALSDPSTTFPPMSTGTPITFVPWGTPTAEHRGRLPLDSGPAHSTTSVAMRSIKACTSPDSTAWSADATVGPCATTRFLAPSMSHPSGIDGDGVGDIAANAESSSAGSPCVTSGRKNTAYDATMAVATVTMESANDQYLLAIRKAPTSR